MPTSVSEPERASGRTERGSLYVVATPIGNLEDVTQRALRVLREVALLACEDTRHTRKLCERFGITTPRVSLHAHNEAARIEECVARLVAGEDVALVSDAGTPLVSDPGARLVQGAIAAGLRVSPVPGPSAVLAALVASGLAGDSFTFVGFLARKGVRRREQLAALRRAPGSLVLFEAATRVEATLRELHSELGPRRAVLGRELTKRFETFTRGRLGDLRPDAARGELTLVIEAAPEPLDAELSEAQIDALIRELRDAGVSTRDVARRLAELTDLPRDRIYRRILNLS